MPETVRELRHEVARFAAEAGLTGTALDDLRACVSEAVTNAVVHAFRDERPRGTVNVSADLEATEGGTQIRMAFTVS